MLKDAEKFEKIFSRSLEKILGEEVTDSSRSDEYIKKNQYKALCQFMRSFIVENWIKTNKQYRQQQVKQVYYFSMEFLIGRLMELFLIALGGKEQCQESLKNLGINLTDLEKEERDPGLGNGGLGRLAACFMESLAAMQLPGHGCGIRYTYGLFEQRIVDHNQVELPDSWLKDGYVWEQRKANKAVEVHFGGKVRCVNENNRLQFIHEDYDSVLAVPYDVPIVGHGKENKTVNTLRLWKAEVLGDDFDLALFNRGEYLKALEYRTSVESITKILYPQDNYYEGRLLRLKQQYFFVSAGVQSIIRHYKKDHDDLSRIPELIAIHINDTHPAVAIPELMRILMDEEGLGWDEAWEITKNTVAYTNHTILPEALETWNIEMFRSLLPRIYMIVEEINERFCRELWDKYPGDWDRISRMAIIADGVIHMARLAVVGSYSVNGVAALHTQILKDYLLHDYDEYYPGKINNKTNGIAHRRWLLKANPNLSRLITAFIGDDWIKEPSRLTELLQYEDNKRFLTKLEQVKKINKKILQQYVKKHYKINLNEKSIFDVQVKRIHGYKRQLLNVLHIMYLYNRLLKNPEQEFFPRTFIFAGKAAPGYYMAKQIIKLINVLADKINNDQTINNKIKVVFLENYSVSLAEMIFPAADVSEQISTASKEASGTGNMKFMMNGAVTLGTLDGANVEISQEAGLDNEVIFGLKCEEVINYYTYGGYNSWDIYNNDMRVKEILDQLVNGFLDPDHEEFRAIHQSLLHDNDEYFVLRDFAAYVEAQEKIEQLYRNRDTWLKMILHNIAKSGFFSSDRTIQQYADEIWKIKAVKIDGQ